MKKVYDVMEKPVISISKETGFDEIIQLMKTKQVGKLPVIENNRIIGVVTRDDILVKEEKAPLPPIIAFWDLLITLPSNKAFEKKLKKVAGYKAEDIMSDRFLTIEPTDTLDYVVTEILEYDYGYALVVENDELRGIITKSDLIQKIY